MGAPCVQLNSLSHIDDVNSPEMSSVLIMHIWIDLSGGFASNSTGAPQIAQDLTEFETRSEIRGKSNKSVNCQKVPGQIIFARVAPCIITHPSSSVILRLLLYNYCHSPPTPTPPGGWAPSGLDTSAELNELQDHPYRFWKDLQSCGISHEGVPNKGGLDPTRPSLPAAIGLLGSEYPG